MKKIFISGSISIKALPKEIENFLEKIIEKGYKVLVGDAVGVDSLIQKFFALKEYKEVAVYTVENQPRNYFHKFEMVWINPDSEKSGREKQQVKDIAMTKDADELLVIWNGKSKGSKENILRGLKYGKKVVVFLNQEKRFLEKVNSEIIEKIFRDNYGYSATELVKEYKERFKSTKKFYELLLQREIIKKDGNIYMPIDEKNKYIIIDYYKGRPKGVRFKRELMDIL